MQLEKRYLSNWERDSVQFNAERGAGYCYRVFGGFFAEVLKRYDCTRNSLDFIQYQQGLIWLDSLAAFGL